MRLVLPLSALAATFFSSALGLSSPGLQPAASRVLQEDLGQHHPSESRFYFS